MDKAKIIRNVVSVMLVALMTLCAELTSCKEYIFPEVGALCIGLWVVNKHVWRVQKWQIPVIFTLAAIVGVCIVRYLPIALPLQMELGFIIVALMLMAFDASITPAISACMLPVLMGTDTWLYPLVVLVCTAILTIGQYLMEQKHIRRFPDEDLHFSVPPSRVKILLRWIALMIVLAPIMVVADYLDAKFVMVPPLIVTLVEFSNSASGFRQRPLSTWMIILFASMVGAFAEGVMHQMWYIPQTLCATMAVSVVLLFFDRVGKYFAPAVAIALVPMIIPAGTVLFFPLYIAVGSAYFILMAEACFCRKVRSFACKRLERA